MLASRKAKLETHLRVAHGIAVLFAVMSNGDSWKSARAGLVHCLDDKFHVRRVVDLEVQAGMPPPGLPDKLQNGFHAATSTSSAVAFASVSASGVGCKVARMTAEVCRMTSSDSARSDALPW